MKIYYDHGENRGDYRVAVSIAMAMLKNDIESWEKIIGSPDTDKTIVGIGCNAIEDDKSYLNLMHDIFESM